MYFTQDPLCTAVAIDNRIFFKTTPTKNMVNYSDLLAVKYLNLILWQKVYKAFNDLHILKALNVIWMKNML